MSWRFPKPRERRFTGVLVAVLLAAVAVAGLSASAAGTTTRPGGYWIVLASDRDGEIRAYSVRPDGSRLTLLLPRTRGFARPGSMSRDGSTIAYNLSGGIYVSRANGTGLRRVVRTTAFPVLSPDGKRLAFSSGFPPHIVVIGTDGRGRRRLMSQDDQEPNWSPDGKALVFVERRGNRSSVVVQPLHGRRRVLVRSRSSGTPTWSPDGHWIAFANLTGHKEGLWVVQPNGAHRHLVARGFVYPFAWSPGGKTIALAVDDKVSIVGVDGRTPRRLRLRRLQDVGALSWSPDGRLLALGSRVFGANSQIWVVGADGRGLRRVVGGGANVVGWTRLAPVRRPASPLLPSERVLGKNTVATRRPIADLSADGLRVAFIVGRTAADCEHVAVWTPATRALNRFRKPSTSCDGGVYDVELAGSRAAWVSYSGCGNFCDVALKTATTGRPRPVTLTEDSVDANEDADFRLRGDGDLLVFNEGNSLVRIGTGKRCGEGLCATLRSGADAAPVDSVSGKLIAIREPDAVAVLDAQGKLVNVFPFGLKEVRAARLDGGRLVVSRSGSLEVYNVATGVGELQRPLPAGYALTDVDGGIAVLQRARTIMLLRLDDGRLVKITPRRGPVLAELEPTGLYYSYTTADGGGRLVLVPRSGLLRQLG